MQQKLSNKKVLVVVVVVVTVVALMAEAVATVVVVVKSMWLRLKVVVTLCGGIVPLSSLYSKVVQ